MRLFKSTREKHGDGQYGPLGVNDHDGRKTCIGRGPIVELTMAYMFIFVVTKQGYPPGMITLPPL